MKLYDIIRMANSNLWRNKSRTLLTVLAIFIGAFTIMMTTGINTGVNNYIDKQVAAVGSEDYPPRTTCRLCQHRWRNNWKA